jgi:hypothetical protein
VLPDWIFGGGVLIQRDGWKILHNIAQGRLVLVSKSAGTAILASNTTFIGDKKL